MKQYIKRLRARDAELNLRWGTICTPTEMKAADGKLFEVKSVNRLSSSTIDSTEYEDKVRQLKDCYRVCSMKLDGYIFYLPLLKDDTWQITRFCNGEEDKSEYWQKADTSVVIQTKTIESYNAEKRL